jgi:hypothetical protein
LDALTRVVDFADACFPTGSVASNRRVHNSKLLRQVSFNCNPRDVQKYAATRPPSISLSVPEFNVTAWLVREISPSNAPQSASPSSTTHVNKAKKLHHRLYCALRHHGSELDQAWYDWLVVDAFRCVGGPASSINGPFRSTPRKQRGIRRSWMSRIQEEDGVSMTRLLSRRYCGEHLRWML